MEPLLLLLLRLMRQLRWYLPLLPLLPLLPRREWRLTSAGGLSSHGTRLNEDLLVAEESGKRGALPPLPPKLVRRNDGNGDGHADDDDGVLTLAGHSVSFFVLPDANWPACGTGCR